MEPPHIALLCKEPLESFSGNCTRPEVGRKLCVGDEEHGRTLKELQDAGVSDAGGHRPHASSASGKVSVKADEVPWEARSGSRLGEQREYEADTKEDRRSGS